MNARILWIACWAIFSGPALADDAPRLSLWITQAIAGWADVSVCSMQVNAPPNRATLTERDVVAWDEQIGGWVLDTQRFPDQAAARQLADHCFVLTINGKPISSGVVLWRHSARLVRIPTLLISSANKSIVLQLASGNRNPIELIHVEALAAVLSPGRRP
jgi:hypothetical protein